MDAAYYEQYARVEDEHWWFRARRRIVARVLDGLGLPPDARLLEAGCGTGGNLPLLARYGTLDAFEIDDRARELAGARGVVPVRAGALPDRVPFDGPYDAILLLDVLEHVEDDAAALAALHARLRVGGHLVLTVPAFMLLWSRHDVVNHHFRRYRRGALLARLRGAGFTVPHATYFNATLFPPIAAVRLLNRLRGVEGGSDADALPGPALNRLLEGVFAAERFWVPQGRLPFGVSLLAVARRDT